MNARIGCIDVCIKVLVNLIENGHQEKNGIAKHSLPYVDLLTASVGSEGIWTDQKGNVVVVFRILELESNLGFRAS